MKYAHNVAGVSLIMILGLYCPSGLKAQDTISVMPADTSAPVQVAYGTQPGWMVTTSRSSVTGSQIQKSFTPGISNALFGRLAGLTLMQGSGEPGNDAPYATTVRGINTYGAASTYAPLVIVDGFESTYNMLSPDEIETVVLLKDAAATAMYGNRSANGVLLINTKRGIPKGMVVNFSTRQGFQQAARLPSFLGSADFAQLYNEGLTNDGQSAKYTQDDIDAYRTGSDPYFHPDINWYNEVLRNTAPISNYNLNFSGGGVGVKYFTSLNVLTNGNLYKRLAKLSPNSEDGRYTRYNLRSNLDIQLTRRLAMAVNLGGIIEDRKNPGDVNTDAEFSLLSAVPPNAFPVFNPNGTLGGNALYANPYGNLLQKGFYSSNARTLQSSLRLTEQLDMITPGLSVTAAGAFNNYFRNYSNKSRTYEYASLGKDAGGNIIYPAQYGANTNLVSDESVYEQWRNTSIQAAINYSRTLNLHHIDLMMNYNMEQALYQNSNITTVTANSNGIPFVHQGFGGRFTYTYNDKYIGEVNVGYYGSDNFAPSKHYGFFPAISAGWIVSKEPFMKDQSAVNFLKIKSSYGLSGNDNTGAGRFAFRQDYPVTQGYYFGTSNTYTDGRAEGLVANPNLTWEKQKQLNVGLEATLFKHVDFSLEVFRIRRSDILAQPRATVPQYTGTLLPFVNLGQVDNHGFEIAIGYHTDANRKWQYHIEASAWYARNKLTNNGEPVQKDAYLYSTGQSIGQPFVLQAIGFFQDEADVANSPRQSFAAVQPGDLKYKDQNNDNVIDLNDAFPIGKADIPQLTAALNGGIKYNRFNLDVFFQAVSGRTVYLGGNYFQAFQNNGKISTIALGRWTPSTASSATYPRLSSANNLNNFQNSSFWQRDGSFIKLRSLELGYDLSSDALKHIKITGISVFLNGTNLFSIDHIRYTDPETLSGYPAMRTLSAGVRIQF